jgi:SEC-C motif
LPEGHRRVAISLDDAREGPFLVVTREGHFVTCLGRGMSPGELPVVTREKLEGALTFASDHRARKRALHERVALVGGADKLLADILEKSDCLSREEFVAISALQPVLARTFFDLYARTGSELCRSHGRLAFLARQQRPDRRMVESLYNYWKKLWSLGHLLTLATMGERRWIGDGITAAREKLDDTRCLSISWPLVRHGLGPLAHRGAWAIGRVGKPLLPIFKATFAAPKSELSLFDAALAIGAIGLRNSQARGEVSKVIGAAAGRVGLGGEPIACKTLEEYLSLRKSAYADMLKVVFESTPEALDVIAVEDGRFALSDLFARLAEAEPRSPLASRPEITDDLARTAFLHIDGDYINQPREAMFCVSRLGAVARARAEDFYFPASVIPFVKPRWCPEMTMAVFERLKGPFGGPTLPREVEKKPGRNDACPCASGKKFKRCCGA